MLKAHACVYVTIRHNVAPLKLVRIMLETLRLRNFARIWYERTHTWSVEKYNFKCTSVNVLKECSGEILSIF